MSLSLEKKIYNALGLGLLILVVIGVGSFWSMMQLVKAAEEKEEALALRSKLELVLSHLKDIESGIPTYVITGEDKYLESYNAARKVIDDELIALYNLTSDLPQQRQHLDALQPLIARRFDITEYVIEVRRNAGFEAAVQQVRTPEGRQVMDQIRRQISLMEREQAVLLEQQTAVEQFSVRQAIWVISGGSLLAVVVVVMAIFVINLDFTRRKQAEEALQESEARFRTTFEESPIGIALTDLQGGIFTSNPACQKMFGYSAEELKQMTVSQITYADHLAETTNLFRELINGERQTYHLEKRYVSKDSQAVWARTTASLVRNDQGQPLFVVGMIEDVTERKQAEEALRQSREKYRLVIDNVKEVIFQVDSAGCFTFLNSAWTEIMDFPFKECLGTSYLDYIHPDDHERMAGLFQALWDQDLDYCRNTLRFIARDGHLCWIEVYAKLTQAGDGTILGLSGTFNDISDRKRAEQALQASETRYRTLANHVPVGIFETDAQGNMIFVNHYWCDLTGLSFAEALGRGWTKALPPDELQRVVSEGAAMVQSGREIALECRFQTPAGEIRWGSSQAMMLRNETGEITGYLGAVVDITERKQVGEILAQERNLLRTLIDHIPDYIYIKDTQSRFLINNQAHIRIMGYERQEDIQGKTDFDVFPSELATQYYDDEQKLIRSGQALINHEEITVDLQGRQLNLLTTKVPVQDNYGKITSFVGISRDITSLKRVQDELRQAKDAAEAAARTKSAFLANMSHEIRTPLNAIIGMTSLLLDTPLSPDQREFTETVRLSGDTLLTIINDILDFSKIEAGKLELEMQPFDLRQSIEQSLDLVAVKAAEKKLELAYLVDDKTPAAIVGDGVRLRQILVNLLSNAVKFTETGEVTVKVTAKGARNGRTNGRQPENLTLHFAVRDTGLGIPQERMDRLFKAFSQIDASTTRKYGGTGLGLAISNRLCQLMGGKMWVESAGVPGRGSTFHFTIQTTAAPSQPRIYLRGQHAELTGKRLLVVDDNATNRLMLKRQAQTWGMSSTVVASGAEALDLIRGGHTFDLAILDMHMPEMDGLMVAAEIRRLEEVKAGEAMMRIPSDLASSPRLPLVMLTSLGSPEVGNRAKGVEFAAILNKPVKSSQLYDALIGVFNKQPIKIKPDSVRPSPFDGQLGRRHPLRILLAEDNVVNQKVALRFLDKLGYRADVAATGLEVIAALERQPYDVVLMDVQMPEMDGLEATRLIRRQWPAARSPRIIAMTANALQGDRELCLEAGMDDYIGKPVRLEELSRALSESQPYFEEPIEEEKTSPQPGQTDAALDPAALATLREILGDESSVVITELITLFIDNGLNLLEQMQTAAQAGDVIGLYQGAHTLKPGAAHLGAMRLAALCSGLEGLARADRLEEAVAKFTELKAEFAWVKLALEVERAE